MADDDQATATPAPSDPDLITKYLALLNQPTPNIQPDQTPVDTSGFWGGLRHGVSWLGEAIGGGKGSPGYAALSPAEREAAGANALSSFGTGLLAASRYQPGQTIFSNLAQGFQGAERSYRGAEQDAAGLLAGRQAYATEQQANQLARIKEAIPLLTLQQKMRAIQGLPATLGGGTPGAPGSGTNVAEGGSVSVPAEYLPFYQEASARTGIPAEILIAQGRQESGFNPGATGAAGEIGIGQISPKTATDPGYGMTGIKNPDALRDPRTNINFQADYLAARAKAAGADFSTPEGIAKALKAYNGGGDPNYVQNVTRYIPGAKTALAPPPAAPGQAAVAPPAPPGTNPNAKVQIPPPSTGSALPPPEAPIAPGAGGAQVAGPGAPTAPVIPPSPPGSDATVADIRAGMVGAGADPTTLAVGPVPPAAAPGAATAGPAGPQALAPGSYEEYRLLHPITPSADDLAGFRTTPDAEQIANIRKQAANAQTSYAAARANLDTAGMAKASDDYNTAIAKENELRQNAAKLGTDTRAKFMADQDKQRFDAWTAQQADARQQAQKQADQAAAIRLKEVEGEQARQTGAAASENSYVLDERKRFGLERDSARTNIDDLQMLTALSNAAGTSTPLENIRVGDKSGRDFMVQWGLGTEAAQKQWGAQQAFEAAVNKTVTGLRQGMSMGQLSDRDMAFIQHMAPNLLQHPQTRADIIAYLEQAQYRKLQYTDAVEQLWDGGKGMSWGQAKREAQKQQSDYVPKVPDEYTGWDAPTRKAWLQTNARPGQLMRGPDGRLSIYQPPQQGGQ